MKNEQFSPGVCMHVCKLVLEKKKNVDNDKDNDDKNKDERACEKTTREI